MPLFRVAVVVAVVAASPALYAGDPVIDDKPLSRWEKQLHDVDDLKRIDAARAIGKLGPDAVDAVSDLCDVLGEEKGRWVVQYALVKIGPKAIPTLEKKLNSAEADVRSAAAEVLVRLGRPAIPALIRHRDNPDCDRRALAECLKKLGADAEAAVPLLIEMLSAKNNPELFIREREPDLNLPYIYWIDYPTEAERITAAEALVAIGPKAIPALLKALEPTRGGISASAVAALADNAPNMWRALLEVAKNKHPVVLALAIWLQAPAVLDALSAHDHYTRALAAWALGQIGESSDAVRAGLMRAAADRHPQVRVAALHALGRLKASDQALTPLLLARLQEGHPLVRQVAVGAAMALRPQDHALDGTLLDCLKDNRHVMCWSERPMHPIGFDVDAIIENGVLHAGHSWVREAAFEALLGRGEAVRARAIKEIEPRLLAEMKDAEEGARFHAVTMFCLMGTRGQKLAPALERLLEDPELPCKGAVFQALLAICPDRSERIARLYAAEKDATRVKILRTTRYSDNDWPLPLLGTAIADENRDVRAEAIRQLDKLRRIPLESRKVAKDNVRRFLKDTDQALAFWAARLLLEDDASDKDALAACLRAIQSEDLSVAQNGLQLLYLLGAEAKAALPQLRELLNSKDHQKQQLRLAAIKQIGRIGPTASAMIPDLIRILEDTEQSQGACLAALSALGNIGAVDKQVVRTLIKALSAEDREANSRTPLRHAACEALQLIGPEAKAAVPALTALLKTDNNIHAVRALGSIGPAAEDSVPMLLRRLDLDRSLGPWSNRPLVFEALANIGPGAAKAGPLLQEVLQMERGEGKADAAKTLWHITSGDRKYLTLLCHMAQDSREEDHWAAFAAIESLAPASKGAMDFLRDALKSSDPEMQSHAAISIGRLGHKAVQALPEMVGLLAIKATLTGIDWSDHHRVLEYLEDLGPQATAAIPALEKFIASDNDSNITLARKILATLSKAKP